MKSSRLKEFLTKKMRNRYRLIIRNDRNLAERVSIILTPLNVVLLFSGLLVVFTAISIYLLPLTPLRYLMPGGGEINPRHFKVMKQRLDSIERVMYLREQRDSNLYRILRGEDSTDTAAKTSYYFEPVEKLESGSFSWIASARASSGESKAHKTSKAPRSQERELRLSGNYAFFTPLKGIVTDTFDLRRNHPAVDVVSYNNAAVKATLDGTVILSSWTPETGHVMLLQHTDNIISVYKHNSVLLKKQGAQVQAGEVIALMGNSGELTTGPHLHFELWQNGRAVNPLDYIKF